MASFTDIIPNRLNSNFFKRRGIMKILAIHYGHNATVAYSENGSIICILSEERLSRIKNATGFPEQALNYVIANYLSGNVNRVDKIVFSDFTGLGAFYLLKNGIKPKAYMDYYWKRKEKSFSVKPFFASTVKIVFSPIYRLLFNRRAEKSKIKIIKELKLPIEKVEWYDHHTSHAASCLFFIPSKAINENWLIFTLDGEGDNLAASISIKSGDSLKRVSKTTKNISIGGLFAEVTGYLGMKPNEHEFKLMGMAPYADDKQVSRLADEFRKIICIDANGEFRSSVKRKNYLKFLKKLLQFERFDVICGAIQKLTEELVCNWIEYHVKTTNIRNVACSGGVFMNVKAVKKIYELQCINNFSIVPSASDESLPIGAQWLSMKKHNVEPVRINDLYLGRSFSNEYVKEMIERDKLAEKFTIEEFNDTKMMSSRIGQLLADDEIIARCAGREEWGARALGNRSIICNPSKFQNIERLNNKIKNRDFWMPFTPSILEEDVTKYFLNPRNLDVPYMAVTFESTDLAKIHFAAAVHPRDFTMRPQVVYSSWNYDYYSIISEFKKLTEIGGVLNTSFNLHGEPNVGSPEDAVKTVLNSGLDFLLFDRLLFIKK